MIPFKLTKLNVLISAVTGTVVLTSNPIQAAQNDEVQQEMEAITVTGYRTNLARSKELKKNATGSQDSILAEDIGEFPDANLAESLQRVPGVSISRDSGEGRQISLRGLGPNFTRTRLNGMEALFTSDSGVDQRGGASRTRDFDFSVFASELFNRVDVYKSYDASLDEGGIAGTVDLHTAKPFDNSEEGLQGAVSVKGIYNDRTQHSDPRFAALLSNTWGDFGALVSVAYSQVDTIEEGYHVWSWRQASFGADNVAPSVDSDIASRLVNATGNDRVFVPRANNIASWANTRKRTGITTAFQWQPSDALSFDLDILYGKLSNDRVENQLSTAGTNAFTGDVTANQLLVDAAIDGDDLVYASFEGLDLRTESKVSYGETDFYQISLGSEFELSDKLTASALIGFSKSDFTQPIHDKVFSEAVDHAFSVDWRNASYGQNTYDFDITNTNEWALMRTDVREDEISNEYTTYQIDFNYELDDIHSFKFGAQSKNYQSDGFERRDRVDWENDPNAPEAVFQITDIPVLHDYAIADNQATFDRVVATSLISRELDASHNRPGTVYQIEEDTLGLYAQYLFNTQLNDLPIRGNIGVRWYETDQTSSGEVNNGSGFEQITFNNTYSDILPSLNVVMDISEQWLVRFGANRNISRPNLDQLKAAGQVGVADQFISAGNPNLERFVADSFETSFEFYGDSSSLAIALFYKDMESFIVQQSVTLPYEQTGYPLEFLDFDPRINAQSEFTVSQPINGDSADVTGLEVAFQMDFDFLPEPFNYLGMLGNVTIADGETILFNEGERISVTPPGLSELSHNFTLYYETPLWGMRLSSSYRDEYITGEGSEQNIVAGYDETTFVDFKSFMNITEQVKVTFEATNLTDEVIRQFLDHRTQSYSQSGRNFALGVSYKF
ncbi:TonB-dependent receptor [Pseudoalteromonas sp. MMG006]|uniref:TonB-dependent receptor n=1 Tax=unclassified Pseudoalteromonas TaxID=194690 RepID=UPI001B3955A0|nr:MULTISPECIES: TonB-dependent receptor [unclassified Pseudoalteromonas]MBQ4800339.1 TonB-dependent receptor [Pseudoalteromonas sp. MMG006]MBQ4859054.1 TonB-dependent receptor [Pseudoalteromonas sp. MMG007]